MKYFKLLVCFGGAIAITFAMGYLSSMLINTDAPWWIEATKPNFTPSSLIFQIFWAIIYLCLILTLTISIYRKKLHKSLIGFAIILPLNILWCLVFFTFGLTLLGLGIITLQIGTLLFITNFYIKNTKELWIAMVPMLLWYLFLFLLNYGMVMLN